MIAGLSTYAEMLMSSHRASKAGIAKPQASPTPSKPPAREADRNVATKSSFAHLRPRGHLFPAARPGEPAASAPRQVSTPESLATERADFIIQSAAKARGEIPIPLPAPQTANERAAQAMADFIGASAAKARPSLYGGAK